MRRLGWLRGWLAAGAVAGCALATNTSGCGGGNATTSNGLGEDGGGDATSSGASSGLGSSTSSSSGGLGSNSSSSGSGGGTEAGEDSGGEDAAADSSSSSSSGGGDSGSDSSADSSSSGGADSGSDSSSSSSGGADSGSDSSSSSSSGGADSGSEASTDAASEAGPSCSPANSACALGTTHGICVGGTCTACSGASGTNAACSSAYDDGSATGYVCASGSCTPGNCNSSSDCGGADLGFICTANVCMGCTTDAQCHADAHYGASTICDGTSHACVSNACVTAGATCSNAADICCGAGPTCVPGNCCTNGQCSGTTPACNPTNDTCAACDAPGGTAVVVDPLNGVDATTNGSGTVGGQTDGICAFRTIGYALLHLGTATTVKVLTTGPVSAAGNGETFPIDVTEAGVTITGSGGTPTVNDVGTGATGALDTQTGTAFILDATGVVLSQLVIDGVAAGSPTAIHGIVVAAGSTTLATTISNVEIRNFTEAGIRVQDTGMVTIGAGTNSHNNGIGGTTGLSGLHVTDTAVAAITGSATGAVIQFSHNGQDGILVDTEGSVTITGSGAGGSVQTEDNTLDGVVIDQSDQTNLNTITGLLSQGNSRDGLRIFGDSAVEVRGSSFLGNAENGIDVETGAGGGLAADVLMDIDLGSVTNGSNAGGNDIQDPTSPNVGAGLCLNITRGSGQTLHAEGNLWSSGATPAAAIDCSTTAGTLTISPLTTAPAHRNCTAGVDIGGTGLNGPTGLDANAINVDECGCGATNGTAPQCQ